MSNRAPQANAVPCEFLLHVENVPHRISCLFLCCRSHMGIGIRSELGEEVVEYTGYGFYVNPILQCNRSKGVAEVVESDLRYACSFRTSIACHEMVTVR